MGPSESMGPVEIRQKVKGGQGHGDCSSGEARIPAKSN